MNIDKKSPGELVGLQNKAKYLESNKAFVFEIEKLSKKKKISLHDTFQLRTKLADAGITHLSDYWDEFLLIKIKNPQFSLHKIITIGSSIIKLVNKNTDEVHYAIEVFPYDTSLDDVKEAYSGIVRREELAPKCDFREKKSFEYGEKIDKMKKAGKNNSEIRESLDLDYVDMNRYWQRYKKGINKDLS
jgi:hypothetical protein